MAYGKKRNRQHRQRTNHHTRNRGPRWQEPERVLFVPVDKGAEAREIEPPRHKTQLGKPRPEGFVLP